MQVQAVNGTRRSSPATARVAATTFRLSRVTVTPRTVRRKQTAISVVLTLDRAATLQLAVRDSRLGMVTSRTRTAHAGRSVLELPLRLHNRRLKPGDLHAVRRRDRQRPDSGRRGLLDQAAVGTRSIVTRFRPTQGCALRRDPSADRNRCSGGPTADPAESRWTPTSAKHALLPSLAAQKANLGRQSAARTYAELPTRKATSRSTGRTASTGRCLPDEYVETAARRARVAKASLSSR